MQFVEPIRDKCEIFEVKKILGKKSKRDLLLFSLGINSGLRISDILKLKVKDVQNVDFIEIKEQKTLKSIRYTIFKGQYNVTQYVLCYIRISLFCA